MRGTQVRFSLADAYRLRAALAAAEADSKSTEGKLMPKSSVKESKHDRQRGTTFAKGGDDDRMFRKQAAGPARSGQTDKNQRPAPSARAAKDGKHVPVPGRVLSAKGGRTGVR
jgi:hypothetical protein